MDNNNNYIIRVGDKNMRKLLKMLKNWNLKRVISIELSKWHRDILFEFFTEYMDKFQQDQFFRSGRR